MGIFTSPSLNAAVGILVLVIKNDLPWNRSLNNAHCKEEEILQANERDHMLFVHTTLVEGLNSTVSESKLSNDDQMYQRRI